MTVNFSDFTIQLISHFCCNMCNSWSTNYDSCNNYVIDNNNQRINDTFNWRHSIYTAFWPRWSRYLSHTEAYKFIVCRPMCVCLRCRLRSASREDLVTGRTATKFSARSFAVAAPSEWNRLPQHIRAKQSIDSFKVALKSYLLTTDRS